MQHRLRTSREPRPRSHPRAVPGRPARRALRAAALFAALVPAVVVAGVAGGCGKPRPPGGYGRLEHEAGRPDLLFLEGRPYEMGWWHGHLLKDRIRAVHARWQAALYGAVLGGGNGGTGGDAARSALGEHGRLCVDQTAFNLSERRLQELEGMAAATGLSTHDLLMVDVLRDALRMKGLEARLVGAAGLARTDNGLEARAWWTGPDVEVLGDDWLVIHRKPAKGVESVVVTWPGSVGAMAGLLADGRGYLLAAGEMRNPKWKGFGAGRPLNVAALEALTEAPSVGAFMVRTKATMGHVLLGFSTHRGRDAHPVDAMAGFVYYVDPDPPRVIGDARFLAIAPYENPHDPRNRTLQLALRDASRAGDRWPLLWAHADGQGEASGTGPMAILRHEGGAGSLDFRTSAEAQPRVVEIGAPD